MTRLKKLSESVNLGNIIDSNRAIELIRQNYPSEFTTDNVLKDVGANNPSSIIGLISDSGLVAAELFAFQQPGGGYVGAVVGIQINVEDIINKKYTVGTDYQCVLLNDKDNLKGITDLKNTMVAGTNLFGLNCTFNNSIKNIDQLLQLLLNK